MVHAEEQLIVVEEFLCFVFVSLCCSTNYLRRCQTILFLAVYLEAKTSLYLCSVFTCTGIGNKRKETK